MATLSFALAIAILLAVLVYYFKPFLVKVFCAYKASLNFPGPKAYPLIGNMNLFIGSHTTMWNSITELFSTYPSPFRLWMAHKLVVCVSEPDDLKMILLNPSTIDKGDNYGELKVWLGNGLLTAPAVIWRRHRKLIMPTFNLKVLESFTPIFSKLSINAAEELNKAINKDDIYIHDYIANLSLGSICENAMGIDLGLEIGKKHHYVEASTRAMEILCVKLLKPWLHLDFIFNCTSLATELSRCLAYIHGVTDDVIAKRRMELKDNKPEEFIEKSRKPTFLNLLLELSNTDDAFTDRELRDEVNTMIIAGSDTCSTTLSFVLLILAMYPEVQDKVYQELYNIYGSNDPEDVPVTYKDLHQMEYIDRVIKETLRIFPIAGIIFRSASGDIKLGTRLIPKGTMLMLGIYAVHHNEKYWPEPFKFDPDRFLPEHVKNRHPFCHIPFSAGPRNCVGMKYADLLLKVVLATLIRKFKFEQNKYKRLEDIELAIDTILKTTEKISLKIKSR